MQRTLLSLSLLCSLLGACASSGSKSSSGQREWLEPSPRLRQQIDDQVARLPWTHGVERVEQINWFAQVGEPAYPTLLQLCVDPRSDVAASAVAALGATRDSRLVEPLHQLAWPATTDRALQFEKVRTFVRLGDWRDIGELIAGLEDESVWARSWCLQALREATGDDFGFDPKAEPEARAASVAQWKAWLAAREGEGILAASKD
jgi:hypothetical protein